ncbi:MAG: hypothetical protein Q7S27_02875 [Nanoarchaeota archaeon]|nr:hypothetical protein [Nanoarchaeota archaeon]
MTYFYLVPQSFLKFSILMQIIFALVALSVSYFSLKIYKISRQREIKLFGISFILIALSYVIWAVIHSAIAYPSLIEFAKIATENVSRLGGIGMLAHVILFISGLITLSYTTVKIKSGKIYYLLLTLGIISLVAPIIVTRIIFEPIASSAVYNLLITSRILSIFFLIFIIYNYFEEYSNNKNKKTLLIGIAFCLLLLSNADFIFSLTYYPAYIMGHILEFIAYLFILISLLLTIKK